MDNVVFLSAAVYHDVVKVYDNNVPGHFGALRSPSPNVRRTSWWGQTVPLGIQTVQMDAPTKFFLVSAASLFLMTVA